MSSYTEVRDIALYYIYMILYAMHSKSIYRGSLIKMALVKSLYGWAIHQLRELLFPSQRKCDNSKLDGSHGFT